MKKKLSLFIIMLALLATRAQAQEQDKNLSIKVGLSLSTITETSDFPGADVKSLTGFTFGFAYQFPVNDQFYIQPELNFVRKGAKLDLDIVEDQTSIDGTINLGIDYLEVPVLAKMYFGQTSTKFYLIGGPSVGYGIGGNAKYNLTITDPNFGTISDSGSLPVNFGDNESENGVNVQNRFDFGLYFGAGVRINNQFIIDARYNLGLSNLSGDSDEESKHRGFQFAIALPIRMNK